VASPEPGHPLVALEQALVELGDALAAADLDRLLASEVRLAAALERPLPGDGTMPRELVDRTRAALLRCRRLGASLDAFLRSSADAMGVQPAYSRQGQGAAPPVRAGSMIARV
jgi:phosphoenolpyruvate synthase/pyruvate phosphate dikinase